MMKRFLPLICLFLAASVRAEHQPVETGHALRDTVKPMMCEADLDRLKSAGFLIPKCPQKGKLSLLTAEYPASAIFIKPHTPGQLLDLKEMIHTISGAKTPTVINVMGSFQADIQKEIEEKYPQITLTLDGKMVQPGKGKSRMIINLVSGGHTGSTFLHDFGKQLVDKKGNSHFFTTRHRGNPETKNGSTPFGEFLRQNCGVSVIEPPPETKSPSHSEAAYGGNYLPITPQHVITGSQKEDGSLDENHLAHLKALKKLGIDHTTLQTHFLSVGHVDEIVAPVKVNREKPCQMGLIIADTEMGWEMVTGKKPLEEKESGSYFQWIPEAHAGITLLGPRRDSPVDCKFLDLKMLESLRMYDAGLMSHDALKDRAFFDPALLQSLSKIVDQWGRLYAEDKTVFPQYKALLQTDPPQYLKFFQQIADKYCIGFSGISRRDYENFAGSTPRLKELQKANKEIIPAIMKKNEEKLRAALIRETGCQDPTIIHIPALYEKQSGGYESVLPNSVNLISLGVNKDGNQLILPDSTSKELDSRIKKSLETHGLIPHFSSSTSCHLLQGDHSCSTSVFRTCDPR